MFKVFRSQWVSCYVTSSKDDGATEVWTFVRRGSCRSVPVITGRREGCNSPVGRQRNEVDDPRDETDAEETGDLEMWGRMRLEGSDGLSITPRVGPNMRVPMEGRLLTAMESALLMEASCTLVRVRGMEAAKDEILALVPGAWQPSRKPSPVEQYHLQMMQ